jgi:hypothetical protein
MRAAELLCALNVFALSRHLRSTGHHDSFGKLKATIIDHNPKWDDKSRQKRESFWIKKLKTLSANGINEKFQFYTINPHVLFFPELLHFNMIFEILELLWTLNSLV